MRALLFALIFFGCTPALDKVLGDNSVDAALKDCRAEARKAFYEDHKTEAEAIKTYDDCVARIPK